MWVEQSKTLLIKSNDRLPVHLYKFIILIEFLFKLVGGLSLIPAVQWYSSTATRTKVIFRLCHLIVSLYNLIVDYEETSVEKWK